MDSVAFSAPRRALLSVSDKTGLAVFAQRLHQAGFELISTGGTAKLLRASGLPVREVSDVTAFPEMLDGRVKTLHPKVHGGLLGRHSDVEHRRQMEASGIDPIEVLVVNLYPFEAVAARAEGAGVELEELIENIDIGGPAMLRSGAKNHELVTVICDPADYAGVAEELAVNGRTGLATRWRLAGKAFARTAAYDAAIARVLGRVGEARSQRVQWAPEAMPGRLECRGELIKTLRYGENPHQRAGLYADPATQGGMARAEVLQGKELSYNNLVDLEAAWELAQEFSAPAVAIIKHTNPAGCATHPSLVEAYRAALACDPVSAFGGVIGINRRLDGDTARAMAELFVECIAAPDYSPEALAVLAGKKNLRLARVGMEAGERRELRIRSLSGGFLAQSADDILFRAAGAALECVTERRPTAEEEEGLRFAWAVAKHVKSNAIVFARGGQTLAVGAGQMSRVDAVRIAVLKAQLPLGGSVLASDAFFPFPDSIEEAAKQGITAIIQPGGSVRDAESIAACNRLGLAMVVTGVRHFRH